MSEYSDIITLEFNHDPGLIPQMVKGLIENIKSQPSISELPGNKALRIGWVLTELLTNAVKHAKTRSSQITIQLSQSGLLIRKSDYGNPLPYLPLNDQTEASDMVTIYKNGPELLTGQVSGNSILFVIDEDGEPSKEDLLSQISEHLGLMIIAKACETFRYEYIAEEKMNIFSCAISLKSD